MHAENHYDESQIQVLEGLEAVRRRPGMYIGSTDERGLHHLVYEIVDNAIDEALAGFCDDIQVTIFKDGSVEVRDNGRGFPVGIHPKMGRPAVEVCLTVLHAGGKFGGGGYKVSGGLHGVGASVVNALSKHLQVNVYQDGKIYQQEYERGKVLYDLKVIGQTERTGTTVRFWPDVKTGETPEPGIFETGDFDFDTLKVRLREMAFLNKGIRISPARCVEPANERAYHYEGGIRSFVEHLNRHKTPLFAPPVYIEGEKNGSTVEVGPAVERRLQRKRLHLRQQHPHSGGRHAPGRPAHGADPRHQRLWPQEQHLEGQRRQSERRGRARGPDRRGVGQTGRAAVRGPDQDQAGQQRNSPAGGFAGDGKAHHLL